MTIYRSPRQRLDGRGCPHPKLTDILQSIMAGCVENQADFKSVPAKANSIYEKTPNKCTDKTAHDKNGTKMNRRDEIFQATIDHNIRRIQIRLGSLDQKLVKTDRNISRKRLCASENESEKSKSGNTFNNATGSNNASAVVVDSHKINPGHDGRNYFKKTSENTTTVNSTTANYLVVRNADGSTCYKPVLILPYGVQVTPDRRGIPVRRLESVPYPQIVTTDIRSSSDYISPIEPRPADSRFCMAQQSVVRNVQYANVQVTSRSALKRNDLSNQEQTLSYHYPTGPPRKMSKMKRGSLRRNSVKSRKTQYSMTSSVMSALLCWKCMDLEGDVEDSEDSQESESGSDDGGDSGGDDADVDDIFIDGGDVSDIDEIEYSSGGGDSDGSSMSKTNSLYQEDIMQNEMRNLAMEDCDEYDQIAGDPNLTNYAWWEDNFSDGDEEDRRAREFYGDYSIFPELQDPDDVMEARLRREMDRSSN
uniref:uncharacterized protein LOC113474230 isoform X1 n=1 Tax=Ciona intestinalis TaxID=7719 RepID=UPI000EF549BC|nr:uncharacterized protein LOC113474230 isoform X1 [Ciona intestinalis]|eukprot:XP_026690316.1 uncharacterized protein LOC113474230 isoform X1 [Ciona intestinalis]